MKKNTMLYLLIIFLTVVNGFFLYNYIDNSDELDFKRPKSPQNFIVKELGFTEVQISEFNSKIGNHHQIVREFHEDIKNLKDRLFDGVTSPDFSHNDADSLIDLIANKEKQRDLEIFTHFKMIDSICNDVQKEKLSKIIRHAMRSGGNEERPRRTNSKDRRRPPPLGEEGLPPHRK